jgi:hypothetical protein
MNMMIHSFYDGTGTAWVPLNRRMCDLLNVLTSEDRLAGVGTFLLLMKGVEVATKEYSDVIVKAQIENSLQSARETEKFHLALEEVRKRSLELKAAVGKSDSSLASVRRANLQLVAEAETKQKQIDSARREQEARVEIEKLHLALEVEKKITLEVIAEDKTLGRMSLSQLLFPNIHWL